MGGVYGNFWICACHACAGAMPFSVFQGLLREVPGGGPCSPHLRELQGGGAAGPHSTHLSAAGERIRAYGWDTSRFVRVISL